MKDYSSAWKKIEETILIPISEGKGRVRITIGVVIGLVLHGINRAFATLTASTSGSEVSSGYFIGYIMLGLCIAYLPILLRFSLARNIEDTRAKEEAVKIKEKYPGLSVIGVFLNRYQATQAIAQNLLSILISLYVIATAVTPLTFEWQFIVAPFIFLVALLCNGLITKYRIRKGYYLNNERETRELIKFIKDNADDIDFTSGSRKILSPEDLEDIVLGGTVGYNPA